MTTFSDPPRTAAWQHQNARTGFEVVFLSSDDDGYRVDGHTAAFEGGEAWAIDYVITLDRGWLTQSARTEGHSATGRHELTLEADGAGGWTINGAPAPELDGCLDLDLEASALTNAFPVRRLGLEVGQRAEAPAAWVRALELGVERLAQRYARLEDDTKHLRYDYTAPDLDFRSVLVCDEHGLVLDYPGLAVRIA